MFTTISTRNGLLTAALVAAFANTALKGESVRQHRGTPRRKGGSNWARLLIVGLGTLVSAEAGLVILPGGTIAVNSMCGTSFGTCSFGIPDPADNGLRTGALAWFQDHFGAFARVSANSTDRTGLDNAGVAGNYWTDLMIPEQQNLKAGDLVSFKVPYRIDGTIAIDFGDNFVLDVTGKLINLTRTSVDFTFKNEIGTPSGFQGVQNLENRHYAGNNHLTDVINDNVLFQGQVRVGEVFQFYEDLYLNVHVDSSSAPTIGFVQADLLHTGVTGPATVLDSSGNPVSNPIVLSANGFDFANPQAAAGAPEPSSVVGALMGALAMCVLGRKRRAVRGRR